MRTWRRELSQAFSKFEEPSEGELVSSGPYIIRLKLKLDTQVQTRGEPNCRLEKWTLKWEDRDLKG